MSFFFNPTKIFIGRNSRSKILSFAESFNSSLLICSQSCYDRILLDEYLAPLLTFSHVEIFVLPQSQATVTSLLHIFERYPTDKSVFDSIFAVGGGSIMDLAKVYTYISSFRLNTVDRDTIIDIGSSIPNPNHNPYLVLIPTTAGTGSEVTPFATLWDSQTNNKLSIAGDHIYPKLAFIDASLHESLPYENTISSALDGINQGIESLASLQYTELFSNFAHSAIILGLKALNSIEDNSIKSSTRDLLAQSSLMSGLAISMTKTGICHSISYPLTSFFGIEHGIACAFTMPVVLDLYIKSAHERFQPLYSYCKPLGISSIYDLPAYFEDINNRFKIRDKVMSLVDSPESILSLVPKMMTKGRCDNTIIDVSDQLLFDIIKKAIYGSSISS